MGLDGQDLPLEAFNRNCFSSLFHGDLWEKSFGRAKMLLQIRYLTPDWVSDLPYNPNPSAKRGCNLPVASKTHGQPPLAPHTPPKPGKGMHRPFGKAGRRAKAVPVPWPFAQEDTTPDHLMGSANVRMRIKKSDRK